MPAPMALLFTEQLTNLQPWDSCKDIYPSSDSDPLFAACTRPLSPSPESDQVSHDEPESALTYAQLPVCENASTPASKRIERFNKSASPTSGCSEAPGSPSNEVTYPSSPSCSTEAEAAIAAARATILDLTHCYGAGMPAASPNREFLDTSNPEGEGQEGGPGFQCEGAREAEPSSMLRLLDGSDAGDDEPECAAMSEDGSTWSFLYHSSDDECMQSEKGDSEDDLPIRILPNIYTQSELDVIKTATAGTQPQHISVLSLWRAQVLSRDYLLSLHNGMH